jgi:hypothetical protein
MSIFNIQISKNKGARSKIQIDSNRTSRQDHFNQKMLLSLLIFK